MTGDGAYSSAAPRLKGADRIMKTTKHGGHSMCRPQPTRVSSPVDHGPERPLAQRTRRAVELARAGRRAGQGKCERVLRLAAAQLRVERMRKDLSRESPPSARRSAWTSTRQTDLFLSFVHFVEAGGLVRVLVDDAIPSLHLERELWRTGRVLPDLEHFVPGVFVRRVAGSVRRRRQQRRRIRERR